MPRPNFELITELQTLCRRDFAVANANNIKPYDSSVIIEGEWLKLDASYKLGRGTSGNPGEAEALVFPVHTEKGRYDVQAVGKVNVLFSGQYEAETALFNGTPALGAILVVQDIAAGVYAGKRGVGVSAQAAASKVISVGFVTKTAANGRIRFIHLGNLPTVL